MENIISRAILTLYGLLNGKSCSHEDLIELIKAELLAIPRFHDLSKDEIEQIVYQYEIQYGSKTFEPGITLTSKEANDSWFVKKKKAMTEEDHKYQARYAEYLLLNHYGEDAKNSIISEAERVLSFCSDPESNDKKRGLVMGDVQSGKTSNYLALANLACDYGYRIILILAGMTDSLRIQTQERVDEGLVGAISSTIGNERISYVGVGKIGNGGYYAVPFTTEISDFTSSNCTSNDLNKPQILVVKKNKSVLTSVKKWLKPGQANISSRNILIIDDECDNASVNTKNDEDPSTINALIRDIYNNFDCSTYVGYTATPFANIFINPEKKMGYDDLFPSDFIHRLITKNESYFGIRKVFDGSFKHVHILNDSEEFFLPAKHKKDYPINNLARSLKDSICVFLLGCCIRTLRGDVTKHRSMMINVSPFNMIQEEIRNLVEIYVNYLINVISQYDKYNVDRFIQHRELERIYNIYKTDKMFNTVNDYGIKLNEKYSFETIKNTLFDEISKFRVIVINNKYKGDQRFKYKEYESTGARVIAIGGFVLSRGLTLEGLMVSYYSRNSVAYDTLLQMCRWFGYRPGYEDLCMISMSQINYDCFSAVVDALDNLDSQLAVMKAQGATPKDFGLMIMESPDTLETNLLITSRNKQKNSVEIVRGLNYSGVDIDTSKLYSDIEKNRRTQQLVKDLYTELNNKGFYLDPDNSRKMFIDVPNYIISSFVKRLDIPLENKKFDVDSISEFIEKGEFYDKWDIVFATGEEVKNEKPYTLGNDLSIPPVHRSFAKEVDEDIIRIAKNNNRLLDPGIFNAGLTKEQIEEAKEIAKNRINSKNNKKDPTPIAKDYLSVSNRKPVLVILPIKLTQKKDDYTPEKERVIKLFGDEYLIGFGIGFAGREGKVMMRFRLNKVKQQEYLRRYCEEEEFIDD